MMKNKIKLKRLLVKVAISSIIGIIIILAITSFEYAIYTRNFNNKLSSIVATIESKYPDLTQNEIIEIVNSKDTYTDIFKKYNIDIDKDSLVLENDSSYKKFMILNSVALLTTISIVSWLFLRFNNKKDKEINEITRYIEEINRKNYRLHIDEISEDEMSILKNELYKITIMLKEQAENSTKEKLELKDSLSDISHQLKTPLTSILIILDNLIEDSDMDTRTREDFLFDIKREINNVNFLVQNILKLSKLDTNTINFINEKICIDDIIEEAISKLSMLCELKKVNINFSGNKEIYVNVDKKWQVEAISNIAKNCIEHSKENSFININVENNKIYSQITIKDYGTGISKEDLPHIFERFYRGKNACENSVGIGLALAKSIIEKSNGKILVETEENQGTTFIIRYYN